MMSAFVLNSAHIDALVTLAVWGPRDSAGDRWGTDGGLRWDAVP